VSLTPDKRLEQRLTGTFTAKALAMEGNGIIEIKAPGLGDALVEIDVVEPEEPLPPKAPLTFEFERSAYRVPAGKRKQVFLLAPNAAVERHGSDVVLDSSNPHGVLIRQQQVQLTPSPDGDWHQVVVEVEARQHGAKATVTAQVGSGPLKAETSFEVRSDRVGPTPPQIKLAALNSFVRGTFETDEEGQTTITVNATHPAVRRYFGPHPDFPKQESVEARMMIAEVAADLTVLDIQRRHLRERPIAVEQMYRQRYQWLNDLLPQCHASQLAEGELSVSKAARTSTKRPRVPA
jgi:hypothetical protein